MATTVIVGDGPAGLSAALFLAKNGQQAVVLGEDETPMHHALLRNYLGIEEVSGTEFQRRARAQVEAQGARLRDVHVAAVSTDGDGVVVTTGDDERIAADYLILAAAKQGTALARQLGVEIGASGVDAGADHRVADGVYAVGRLARPKRSQAIISAGAGAVAALDILAREAGEDVTDWDSPAG